MTAGLTEFSGPYPVPSDITTGSDGNFWVLNSGSDSNSSLTVVSPAGTVLATYAIPTVGANASALTLGPDGNIWFVEQDADKIGEITPTGAITEYAIPNTAGSSPLSNNSVDGADGTPAQPTSIVTGPDGALWFTESSADAIGRLDPATGAITQIPTPGLQPNSITLGPDNAIWFTDNSTSNTIDRLNSDGTIAKFPLPSDFSFPTGLTTGPDGALWFAEAGNNAIGRITTAGVVTELPILGNLSSPERIAFDSAGNIWVTGSGGGLARVTPQGLTTLVSLQPASDIDTQGITVGPGGSIWFTDTTNNTIGMVDPTTVTSIPSDNPLSGDPSPASTTTGDGSLDFNGQVDTFFAGNPSTAATDFTAQINWGDGTSSVGSVSAAGAGQFAVSGSHTYAQIGTYPLSITINDVNPGATPQPDTVILSTSLVLNDDSFPLPPPTQGVGSPPISTPVDTFGSTGTGGSGAIATSTSQGSATPPKVSTKPTESKAIPSAVDLLRAGFVPQWWMPVYYFKIKQQVHHTAPKPIVHHALPAPKRKITIRVHKHH